MYRIFVENTIIYFCSSDSFKNSNKSCKIFLVFKLLLLTEPWKKSVLSSYSGKVIKDYFFPELGSEIQDITGNSMTEDLSGKLKTFREGVDGKGITISLVYVR